MLGTLTIGTTNLTTAYRVYVTDAPIYNAPEPDVTSISIMGRSGDLFVDNKRYKNITVEYPCVIPAASGNQASFASCIAGLRAFLLSNRGYVKIANSFDTSEYRMGRYVGGLEVDPTVTGDAATFKLVFDCQPQRWLVSGDTPITLTRTSSGQSSFGSITNPTLYEALPIITVTGSGSGNVMVTSPSDESIYVSISSMTGSLTMDSQLQDAYYDGTNLNDKITLAQNMFLKLFPGVTRFNVTTSFNVSRLVVTPRWWTV